MVNKAIIIGNLGKDPEVRYTQNGLAVCTLTIATSEKYKDKEETEWHRVTLFKNNAENAGKYLKKGSKVYIEGKIKTESWEKDGEKKYSTGIIGNVIQFLDSAGSQQRDHGSAKKTQEQFYTDQNVGNPAQTQGGFDNFDDDIPFNRFMDGEV